MNKRFYLALLLVLTLLVSACATTPVADTEAGGEAAPAAEGGDAESTGVAEFRGIWPYSVPPAGHFNTFVSNSISGGGIFHHLQEPPLFFYMWADDDWMPVAAESWEQVDDTTVRVTLPEGAVWSDGSDYTSEDVVNTFYIQRLQGLTVWNFLEDVVAVDDTTVDFLLLEPSNTVLRRILRETNIRPTSTYGEIAAKAREVIESGADNESSEWQAVVQELNEFRPDSIVSLGPYVMDVDSITESQFTMNKNESSFMADWVNFDQLLVFNGETPDATPLMLAKEADYATHGFPPATDAQFQSEGIRVIRGPNYNGPALYLNHDVYPFNVKEFRQALAYAIDRTENGIVSMSESGIPMEYISGFSENLHPLWLTEETVSQLNTYEFNRDTATAMLEELGFTKGDDGIWIDDQGNRLSFELTAPSEYADWSAAAENLAEQLTAFGVETTFRGITFTEHPALVRQGNFEMAIRDWGAGNPHPQFAYNVNFNSYNYTGGVSGDQVGSGMNFPLEQDGMDIEAMVIDAGQGADRDAQAAIINELALFYNEMLPQIPLWERYGNNPAVEDLRVTGWPADDDPIYLNGTYADPFSIVLILQGELGPAQ